MSDVPCTCKNSYWLYFVGSVDYVCLTCHVSYHLLNTQGSAPGLLTVSGNTDTITGPIFSPGATSASGTVPALSPQRAHIIYFVKMFREFNLPKDCPLVCPQGRGMKLSHYKERKKASYSSFSSLLCEEHAQLKWFHQRQIPWAFSNYMKGSEQGTTLQGLHPWMGQDIMGCSNTLFLFTLSSKKSRFKLSDWVLISFQILHREVLKITSPTGKSNFWLTYPNLQRITVSWYSHRGSQQHTECHIHSPQLS